MPTFLGFTRHVECIRCYLAEGIHGGIELFYAQQHGLHDLHGGGGARFVKRMKFLCCQIADVITHVVS
ncbi:hypothetical protein [Paraburkholderia fungorum]